ncbi:MAG: DUF58 domain-containing protein [Acidobacteriota bacterium]
MVTRAVQTEGTARFIEPNALRRISSLDLLAKTVVEGFVSGLHRSPFVGRSMDFAEYRSYLPGDDIRQIDWKVYSRTDRFYVKQFEGDTNTNISFILDCSKSMDFGSGPVTKLDYGKYLCATLAYFAHRQKDRVGLLTFDDEIRDVVPPAAKHLEVVLHTIDRLQPGGQGQLLEPLTKATDLVQRRGITVVVSDFYEDPEVVFQALAGLRMKGSDLMLFHLLDPAEIHLDFEEPAQFTDLESGETIPVVPDALREQYCALVQQHVEALRSKLDDESADYTLIDTSQPLDHALFDYLNRRQWAMKSR